MDQRRAHRAGHHLTVLVAGDVLECDDALAGPAFRLTFTGTDVAASIQRTGRCVVMHEGPRSLGYGAGLAARIQEEMFYQLEAPVLRACGFDTPYPPARLEKLWLPGPDRLLDCVERVLRQP